jgi:hypothetical protein
MAPNPMKATFMRPEIGQDAWAHKVGRGHAVAFRTGVIPQRRSR